MRRSAPGPSAARGEGEIRTRSVVRPELGVVLMADGVAGKPHADKAAELAIAAAEAHLRAALGDGGGGVAAARSALVDTFRIASWAVLEAARCDDRREGMATTLVAAVFTGDRLVVANVGNSRVTEPGGCDAAATDGARSS